MKTLTEQLGKYAAYHRDRRNVATHLVGVPMIVLAVAVLLSRPALVGGAGPVPLSPALLAITATALYYLRLDLRFGLVMAALLALAGWVAAGIAALDTLAWLGWGVGLFVVGWIIQFVGHYFEGRKPAFVDDVMGLLIGPLFVVAEVAFLLGLRTEVQRAMAPAPGGSAPAQAASAHLA